MRKKRKSPSQVRRTQKWVNKQKILASQAIDEITRQVIKEAYERNKELDKQKLGANIDIEQKRQA